MSPAEAREARWELQDLRERLVLAYADQVRFERRIREILQDPRNRHAASLRGPVPRYADIGDALRALRLSQLSYLHAPGRQNRVQPGVLLARHEEKATETGRLAQAVDELERRMTEAGIVL